MARRGGEVVARGAKGTCTCGGDALDRKCTFQDGLITHGQGLGPARTQERSRGSIWGDRTLT